MRRTARSLPSLNCLDEADRAGEPFTDEPQFCVEAPLTLCAQPLRLSLQEAHPAAETAKEQLHCTVVVARASRCLSDVRDKRREHVACTWLIELQLERRLTAPIPRQQNDAH